MIYSVFCILINNGTLQMGMRKLATISSISMLIISSIFFGIYGIGISQTLACTQAESQLQELCYSSSIESSYSRLNLRNNVLGKKGIQFTDYSIPNIVIWNKISANVVEDLFMKHCSYLI